MNEASHYHAYLYDIVSSHLGSRVLEIGTGFGQYSKMMAAEGKRILTCDIETAYVEAMNKAQLQQIEAIQFDLAHPEDKLETLTAFKPDSILCMNVLEHIDDDVSALKTLYQTASPGTELVLVVPALQQLYTKLDAEAGHFRRYSKQRLEAAMIKAGWDVSFTAYKNAPGIPGWLAAGVFSRNSDNALDSSLTNGLIRIYDTLFVKLSKLTDPLFGQLAGLSLLGVASKKSA